MEAQTATAPTMMLRQIATSQALERAWRKVRANRGAAGIDAITLREFERNKDQNLTELARNLLNRTYEPLPARNVNVPKSNGKERELAIPTVRDRVAQRAVLDAIEPLFEPRFLDCSYAFRPGRSVEMAVQKIIVARAQGYRWTVDADIHDFFPTIDNQLLLEDLSRIVNDSDLIHLINLWLEAGVLKSTGEASWFGGWRAAFENARMSTGDAVNELIHEFVSEKLGNGEDAEDSELEEEIWSPEPKRSELSSNKRLRGAAVRRLIKDGVLLALAERTVLRSLLGVKLLGLGGAALALGALTPPVYRKLRDRYARPVGTLQGSPISPMLSNIYLHSFDVTLTPQAYRLIRYCDDFVILCRSGAEAQEALGAAGSALQERRLALHPEKTRLIRPGEPFSYLGYSFEPDGKVVAPPNIPEVISRRVAAFADSAAQRTRVRTAMARQRAKAVVVNIKDKAKSRARR